MNLETGEIKEFPSEEELQEAIKTGKWIKIRYMPDPECRKCSGVGHRGVDPDTMLYIPCDCISRKRSMLESMVDDLPKLDEETMKTVLTGMNKAFKSGKGNKED